MSAAPPQANPDRTWTTIRLVALTLAAQAAALAFATDWDSPIRIVLVLGFLLFVPGLAIAELLGIREPLRQLAIAAGASLAVETLVGIGLLYAGLFSARSAFAIVVVLTVAAVAGAALRARRDALRASV